MLSLTNVTSAESLKQAFYEWHTYLNKQNLEQANILKKALKGEKEVTEDETNLTHFKLLEYRTLVEERKFEEAKDLSIELQGKIMTYDSSQSFYFYFIEGIYHHELADYDKALKNFIKASEFISNINDDLSVAEYYYKLGGTFYVNHQSFYSIENINQALIRFKELNFDKRIAGCKLLLGLGFTDLGEYSVAEEYFHEALSFSKKSNDKSLEQMTLHNLGLFYSEQKLSEASVRYLTRVLEDPDYEYYLKVVFLITKEYIQLKDTKNAREWYEKGIELSKDNNEYQHKFSILHSLYLTDANLNENAEGIFDAGIEYFKQRNQWVFVEDYSEQIAHYLSTHHEYKKATTYYQEASNARKRKRNMEVLK